ncbi:MULTISPECIES: ABC transporter ATP-binding protein [unclassified Mycolicibacterium]|uniref:metal ABC transporter ATP-binding protein n=1 Tax=unclassified Mycolicibacterium TaxID=2636767 RepID=UPI001F4C3A79|nr:ABC transporter ATP-binding protein [Mycolicibacterium sp. YH-1]UNB53386.1 ABC transporter ATP-binding protein [Mycolicibacterium sp. YH-1]
MSTSEPVALSLDDVSVVRGGRLIWSEGTFEVPAGGIVAVIGSSGSGKTTLLHAVLGMIPTASGEIRVLGKPPGEATGLIGYVPQNYAAAAGGAIRARDAVMLGLTGNRWGFGRPEAAQRRRVDEILKAVDAGDFASRRLSQLSGGQRQRIAIAAALVGRPRLLILDEPLTSLDVRNQRAIVGLLARIRDDFGVTIIVVAHDLNPLLGILDGAIYLLDGHAHFDTMDEVVDEELLTHLYGTSIQVVHTPQGELYMRSV